MSFTTDKPKYEHDSACCTFLGTLFNSPDGDHDLYACISSGPLPPVLIARHSSEGGDYQAVTLFGDVKQLDDRYSLTHPLSVALRLYRDIVESKHRAHADHDAGDEDRT